MFQHGLSMEISDQERDIKALIPQLSTSSGQIIELIIPKFGKQRTAMGFLRRMIKLSARPVMKRVNLCAKILSISSACLIAMLTRTELIDGSIMTRSLSFLEMVRGVRRTSFVVL